jgi:hypothetical protein
MTDATKDVDHSRWEAPQGAMKRGFLASIQPRSKEECAMQLTSAQVERTLSQFEAEAIPENHPVIPQLTRLFGEHTFFLDRQGLNILEPAESAPASDVRACKVVYLARWNDADPPSLEPHEPKATDTIIHFEAKH